MKILYVTTVFNTVNAFLVPHIKGLIEKGYEVDIATSGTKNLNSELSDLGCDFYEISFSRNPLKKENITAFREIKRLLDIKKYDVLHTHTPVASAISRLAAKRKPTKVIYTAHGFHFHQGSSMFSWLGYYNLERHLAGSTDTLIVINNEDYLQATRKKMKFQNVYRVNGVGVDTEKFNPSNNESKKDLRLKLGLHPNDFVLFYAAELNANKNQKFLIENLAKIKQCIPEVKLILAGIGPMENELRQLIENDNLEKQVELIGFSTNVNEWLNASDIAVASSNREGLPVNIIEAMSAGLPVVASRVRGHQDLIEDEINGLLFEIGDGEAFRNNILKIYRDSKFIDEISNQNIVDSKKYSIKAIKKEIVSIHEEMFIKQIGTSKGLK